MYPPSMSSSTVQVRIDPIRYGAICQLRETQQNESNCYRAFQCFASCFGCVKQDPPIPEIVHCLNDEHEQMTSQLRLNETALERTTREIERLKALVPVQKKQINETQKKIREISQLLVSPARKQLDHPHVADILQQQGELLRGGAFLPSAGRDPLSLPPRTGSRTSAMLPSSSSHSSWPSFDGGDDWSRRTGDLGGGTARKSDGELERILNRLESTIYVPRDPSRPDVLSLAPNAKAIFVKELSALSEGEQKRIVSSFSPRLIEAFSQVMKKMR